LHKPTPKRAGLAAREFKLHLCNSFRGWTSHRIIMNSYGRLHQSGKGEPADQLALLMTEQSMQRNSIRLHGSLAGGTRARGPPLSEQAAQKIAGMKKHRMAEAAEAALAGRVGFLRY
jgi:hypothetical protein